MIDCFESPLTKRYASSQMSELFSDRFKYTTWRKLWIALATAQKELGLPITEEQIKEMQANINLFAWEKIKEYEKNLRHDVMAHLRAYADLCPRSKGILHLGATSCYVTDNGDLLQISQAFDLLEKKLLAILETLSNLAQKYKDLPCLGYTHFQVAQPTTVGKRICLWLQDFLHDFHHLINKKENIRFLGTKGTTGTQASFLRLFEGDRKKVEALDQKIAEKMGFSKLFIVTGQTYPRKQDLHFLQVLEGIAVSAHKMSTDIRLLSHCQELEESFEPSQVGSSAMPHKRNPIYSERICGISRWLMNLCSNGKDTAAHQWLERSLDDSSNRRLTLPYAFLAADAICNLILKLADGLQVFPKIIKHNLTKNLPLLATENILMHAVKKGGDRQKLHERLRKYCLKAKKQYQEKCSEFDLLRAIELDRNFFLTKEEIQQILKIENFIGCAPEQVGSFIEIEVAPLLSGFDRTKVPNHSITV